MPFPFNLFKKEEPEYTAVPVKEWTDPITIDDLPEELNSGMTFSQFYKIMAVLYKEHLRLVKELKNDSRR